MRIFKSYIPKIMGKEYLEEIRQKGEIDLNITNQYCSGAQGFPSNRMNCPAMKQGEEGGEKYAYTRSGEPLS